LSPARMAELDYELKADRGERTIERAKIFDRSGHIVYSDDRGELGGGGDAGAEAGTGPADRTFADRFPGRQLPGWQAGQDVWHRDLGPGWVWGSGVGRVTVRFETAATAPGPVRTFAIDDEALAPFEPWADLTRSDDQPSEDAAAPA